MYRIGNKSQNIFPVLIDAVEQRFALSATRCKHHKRSSFQVFFIGDIGKSIEINQDFLKTTADVPAGGVMVDGIGVGDVGSIVLRDRKHLAEDGLIIAVCTIDSSSGRIVSGPDIVSRGFVYVRESEELMDVAKKLAYQAVESCADEGIHEWSAIKIRIRDNLSKFLYERTRRNPMILPIIMEI